MFLRRATIEDVGLFDEHFFVYYEETDWLIRAKRRGWRTIFLPTVEAVHTSAGSSPDIRSPHSLLLLESQHRYARKHFGAMVTGLLRATQLGIDTARLARHTLAGRADARAAAVDRIRVHLTMRAPRPS
jgi:GT2 family glycosyltransferase